jgi:RNA polymerase sigma-70 factor (ECF subfamily)
MVTGERATRWAQDAALCRRVQAGEAGAAEALFQGHVEALYQFVHYRLDGDRGRVEDVVQDTFLTAIEGLARFDGRSSLATWLCGIAKNKIRSLRRQRRPRPLSEVLEESEEDIDGILARVASEPLPEWVLEKRETRELVGATLSSLTPAYRQALLDKYVEGKSVAEMAARDGRGVKATESHLLRARLAFARVFELLARRRGGHAPLSDEGER